MEILHEAKMMLELAIHHLDRSGYDIDDFKNTVDKIEAEMKVKNLTIPVVSGCLSNEDERIYKSKVSKMIKNYTLKYLPDKERNAMKYIADEIFKEYNNR